ncbi:hypothetical protein [Phenylobacterium sp.]|uniref:hypothetical protein n=1 Tax=Phenylobacterium sp. TaxID=1871053 RepID=UPI003D2B2F0C
MIAAEPPPAAEAVVVSRRESSEVVVSRDTPLVLTKAGQREQAFVRQAIFVTTSLSLTRPGGEAPALDSWRWAHQAFLQRQVCFSSMTGLFACAEASVQPLTDAETGEAPVSPVDPEAAPESEAARKRLADGLKPRATALFDADRRQHVEPMLKAAGVVAARR